MDLICCRNNEKVETRKSHIVPPYERYINYLNSVIKEKSFDVAKILEYGYFGASIIVNHKETGEELKVRILKKGYVGEEEREWAMLNHLNVLPLLKLEYLKSSDCFLFYSSAEITTLEEKVKDDSFRKDTQSLWKLVYWLEGITDALQYLHSNGFGHLNLQAKSMIITKDDVIQISEFHHLSSIKSRTDKFGFPQALRCPEAFINYGGTWPVKPGPFDSWSLGILIIELFTDFYLSKKLTKKVTTWTKDSYPVIFDVLKKYKFNRLVRKAFPKACGTVDLKSIRYLTAYTLTFDPSLRPSAKQLHNLFIMLNIQKNFFSKIKMEFKKDKIWENKIEWKKFQKHFLRLSAEDNLELLREENLRNSGAQPESSLNSRSVTKEEKNSAAEGPDTKVEQKIERGLEKKDHLIINNLKQKSKKEQKVLMKTQDTIKMAYSAFTFHDTSAFETAVFDLKSASSELSGVRLDKTTASSSKMEPFQKNIQNSVLYIGDACTKLEMERLQENIHNSYLHAGDTSSGLEMQQFQQNIQNSILHSDDTSLQPNVTLNELNKFEKEIDSKSEVYREEDTTGEYSQQVKTGKNIFSIGKRMIQNLIKWSFDDYEMASSTNYLHGLSKRLTK